MVPKQLCVGVLLFASALAACRKQPQPCSQSKQPDESLTVCWTTFAVGKQLRLYNSTEGSVCSVWERGTQRRNTTKELDGWVYEEETGGGTAGTGCTRDSRIRWDNRCDKWVAFPWAASFRNNTRGCCVVMRGRPSSATLSLVVGLGREQQPTHCWHCNVDDPVSGRKSIRELSESVLNPISVGPNSRH